MARGDRPRPFVVLHDAGDEVAAWIAAGLRARGEAVCLVSSLDICTARFDLSIGRAGPSPVDAAIELADGTVLHAGSIRGVLNRLTTIPPAFLIQVATDDRAYVEAEWTAAIVAALHAWIERGIRVLDPPYPYALGGRWRSGAEWSLLAARAGFQTVEWHWPLSARRTVRTGDVEDAPGDVVLVIGDRVLGPAEAVNVAGEACVALARLAAAAILAVELRPTPAGVSFLGATTRPDLRLGAPAAIDALVEALD